MFVCLYIMNLVDSEIKLLELFLKSDCDCFVVRKRRRRRDVVDQV